MDIKKEIEHFRSQALMSRYQSAINLGNKLLEKLGLLSNVFNQDFSRIQKGIQIEVNYCMELNQMMFGDKKKQNFQPIFKKIEEIKTENLSKTTFSKKWKSSTANNELKNQSQILKVNEKDSDQVETNETIEQKIHKNLILPLNMPLFKLKSSIFLIKTNNCLGQVLQYLLNYEFTHFPSMDPCDLGVQNIVNFKTEMLKIGEKRAIIALKNEHENKFTFGKKEIDKLKNIIEVYREMNENEKVSKDAVLVLLIEEKNSIKASENASFLPKENLIKSVSFM